jgi:short-subunit dehydrogenase
METQLLESQPLSSLRQIVLTLRKRALEAVMTGSNPFHILDKQVPSLSPTRLRQKLAHRNVLVSGASSGIGRATALKAAEAGANVLLVARSESKLRKLCAEIEDSGGHGYAYPADLSSAQSTRELLERLSREGIRVDVLVNNAGRSIRRPLAQSWERVHDYERTMALNYFGSLRLILGLLPGMCAQHSGHVINVSSAGVQVGTPLFSAYVASKAALDAFTRVAAGETRMDGVRFTTVHMPLVRTPMILPTEAYREAPALTPEQAADMVLRVLITKERQVGTRFARLLSLVHVLMPEVMEQLLSLGHHGEQFASLSV